MDAVKGFVHDIIVNGWTFFAIHLLCETVLTSVEREFVVTCNG